MMRPDPPVGPADETSRLRIIAPKKSAPHIVRASPTSEYCIAFPPLFFSKRRTHALRRKNSTPLKYLLCGENLRNCSELLWKPVCDFRKQTPHSTGRTSFSSIHTNRHSETPRHFAPQQRRQNLFHVSTPIIITTRVHYFLIPKPSCADFGLELSVQIQNGNPHDPHRFHKSSHFLSAKTRIARGSALFLAKKRVQYANSGIIHEGGGCPSPRAA